jgi:hypothetical protein
MTLGTLGVGEQFGAPSENRGEAYLAAALATLGGVAVSAAVGNELVNADAAVERVAAGIIIGIIPNAFLNAYVYNRVKKPKADAASSRFSATAYVTAYRVGRGEPTPIYGLTLSF